jgi:hypothetical protein
LSFEFPLGIKFELGFSPLEKGLMVSIIGMAPKISFGGI